MVRPSKLSTATGGKIKADGTTVKKLKGVSKRLFGAISGKLPVNKDGKLDVRPIKRRFKPGTVARRRALKLMKTVSCMFPRAPVEAEIRVHTGEAQMKIKKGVADILVTAVDALGHMIMKHADEVRGISGHKTVMRSHISHAINRVKNDFS